MIKKFSQKIFGLFGRKRPAQTPEPVEPWVQKQPPVSVNQYSSVPSGAQKANFRRKQASKPRSGKKKTGSLEQKRIIELLEELKKREGELNKRLNSLDRKEKTLSAKEVQLKSKEQDIERKKAELDKIEQERIKKLEQVAKLSSDEAKKQIIQAVKKRLTSWIAKKIEDAKEEIKSQEDELAKEILIESIRHGVVDWVAEYTVSTITLKNDEVKGRIIGREGRNIRTFERATGVELELDETNDIRLSSFDPVRREIAKIALTKLIKDGRIQPSRIEEVVDQVKKQMDKVLLDEGKRICQAVGVYHLPTELVKLIGKFKYRFSYGQNLAQHTIEETKIGVALANELKADTKIVRLGCLLHDIGKVITDEEGSHIQLGVDLLKRYRLPQPVIDCVAEHHEDKPFSSLESSVVWIADAASGSRPGARYEAHEEYLKRMENVESIVSSFPGVKEVAAYQAGREVRVIVNPEDITDEELTILVQKMAEQLDEEARWAGQIKITAIRETRATATASRRNG